MRTGDEYINIIIYKYIYLHVGRKIAQTILYIVYIYRRFLMALENVKSSVCANYFIFLTDVHVRNFFLKFTLVYSIQIFFFKLIVCDLYFELIAKSS